MAFTPKQIVQHSFMHELHAVLGLGPDMPGAPAGPGPWDFPLGSDDDDEDDEDDESSGDEGSSFWGGSDGGEGSEEEEEEGEGDEGEEEEEEEEEGEEEGAPGGRSNGASRPGFMAQYSAALEAQLRGTTMGESFER